MSLYKKISLLIVLIISSLWMQGQERRELAIGQPDAIVDLRSHQGIQLVKSAWKYSNAKIVSATFNAPGPSKEDPLLLYPTGKQIPTQDLSPKAGSVDFDDSKWATLDPTTLEERRSSGLACYNWYRLNITIPEKIGNIDASGSTIVFEVVVDDYSEIWVNGKLGKTFGQAGNGMVSGFNSRNRVFLTDNAKPGEQFQLAILGINGPLADIPTNYIWIRSATLDVYKEYPVNQSWKDLGKIVKVDKQLDAIIDSEAKIEKLAEGFQFIEGPVWHPDGYLLFSDPNANVIYKYDPNTRNVVVYFTKSGYTGFDIGEYHQPGSNGLTLDNNGRLYVCQHGNRQIIKHERKGPISVISNNYNGKKLNSPNDLVFKSDGALYFTDPPYGLPKAYDDSRKELDYQGIFRVKNGKTELMSKAVGGPNGLAFSPDEKYLYVGNWDIRDVMRTKQVCRFPVLPDGKLGEPELFFDMVQTDIGEAIDGIKVDVAGNVFVSGPGGLWVLSSEGALLGKIIGPERPANMAWGEDGKTLFLAAHTGLYKIRVKTGGKMPGISK